MTDWRKKGAGKIDWCVLNPDDPTTRPPHAVELRLLCLRFDGHVKEIREGVYTMTGKIREILGKRRGPGGLMMIAESVDHDPRDFAEVVWTECNVPDWWRPAE